MYYAVFCILLTSTVLSHFLTRPSKNAKLPQPPDPSFRNFKYNYLLVYLLAVAADWLQGPYIYALYSHYGYDNNLIARLYIAGFASSALFGTIVASVADKYGRRNNALVYCITYILSCATKHSPNFYLLLLGRLLGGISTSILFSAFESWMLYEHHARRYDPDLLPTTFAWAQFGNATVAILAGQLAGVLAKRYGKVMPFDIAICVLTILAVVLIATWKENYGNPDTSTRAAFSNTCKTLLSDQKIILLGVSQSAFEAALYTFTFVWTPALQKAQGQAVEIPHGTIFSTFMAAVMIGTNIFSYAQRVVKLHILMRNVFIVGALVFIAATVSNRIEIIYGTFLIFEVLCGIYYPGMATMRAPYIPEESRSAILTFFRIPLNVIVVVTLYEDLSVKSVFALCAFLMMVAVASQQRLIIITKSENNDKESYRWQEEAQLEDVQHA